MLDPQSVVAWNAGVTAYPKAPPFHPDQVFPEYPFGAEATGPANAVYAAVREMLHAAGMDAQRFGTPSWNPLGELVQPGNTVILKPNFVVSEHPQGLPGMEAAVVHGSVLRPLVDYVYLALEGRGRIIIADSPIKEVDFQQVLDLTGITDVHAFYQQRAPRLLETLDFRDAYVRRDKDGFMTDLQPLPGDPSGYTMLDLGRQSMFHDISQHVRRLRSTAVYYEDVMPEFHDGNHNIYSIPNTLLQADAVISVTKLKTHRKGGVTLSLKNAVGITNEKRSLPHHRVGTPHEGGDSMAENARLDARLEDRFRDFMLSRPGGRTGLRVIGPPLRAVATRVVKPFFQRVSPNQSAIVEGDWWGNDTVWRMALDLNWLLFCADRDGELQQKPQRRYLSVLDGVVAGEGEGPLFPTPKPCGALLLGTHPVLVDLIGARLMGYDWRKIPMLREAVERDWPLKAPVAPELVQVASNEDAWKDVYHNDSPLFRFQPSLGWKGHIEV